MSYPRAFGYGELKSIKSVQTCMMNMNSQPNRAYAFCEDNYLLSIFVEPLAVKRDVAVTKFC